MLISIFISKIIVRKHLSIDMYSFDAISINISVYIDLFLLQLHLKVFHTYFMIHSKIKQNGKKNFRSPLSLSNGNVYFHFVSILDCFSLEGMVGVADEVSSSTFSIRGVAL